MGGKNGNLILDTDGHLPIYGGNANDSDNTGTFYLNVNNTASNSNANIGTHLLLFFIHFTPYLKVKYQNLISELVGLTESPARTQKL